MLLRRDEKGNPYFKVLYENEIDKGNFHLTKTQLLDKLYGDPYHLRNVLLVDFGCSQTHFVSERNMVKLHSGRFGGTRTRKRKRKRNRCSMQSPLLRNPHFSYTGYNSSLQSKTTL